MRGWISPRSAAYALCPHRVLTLPNRDNQKFLVDKMYILILFYAIADLVAIRSVTEPYYTVINAYKRFGAMGRIPHRNVVTCPVSVSTDA
jgi:hypothetical protein